MSNFTKRPNFTKRQNSIQSDDSKSDADTVSLSDSDINFNISSDQNYMDVDEDSNADSLRAEETSVNMKNTSDNRRGCKKEADCLIRSIKGLGWINDVDKDELVNKWVNKKEGITTNKINKFLEEKNYDYKLIEEHVPNIDIYEWVLEMKNNTCMVIGLVVKPETIQNNQKYINEKVKQLNDSINKISFEYYITEYKKIMDEKIEHGYHAVIFCKQDDEVTLWDTQQNLFNGDKYIQNVGKDAINEYLNHTGLSGNNFKIVKREIDIIEKMKKISIKKPKNIKKLKLKKTKKKPNYSENKQNRRIKVTKKTKRKSK
tara:strand:- start:129 stop:1076 length:948 start_codon:yes stop_codon:yes gene_type:complete